MTNQELQDKKEKAEAILKVWNNPDNLDFGEVAKISKEALENYIAQIDEELKTNT